MKKLTTAVAVLAVVAAQFALGSGPAALASAAAAAAAQDTVIIVEMHLTGETTAEGTFTATGALNDSGSATETFTINPPKVAGTKILVGKHGNITLSFEGDLAPVAGTPNIRVQGHWEITSGDGAYANISGQGAVDTMLNTQTGVLHAEYVGSVQGGAQVAGMPRTGGSDASVLGQLLLACMLAMASGITLRATGRRSRSL